MFGMLPPLVQRFLPAFSDWLEYLPWTNSFPLLAFRNYDAPTLERMVAAAEAAGRSAPEAVDLGSHVIMATLWTVLFIGSAFIWFRRRDL